MASQLPEPQPPVDSRLEAFLSGAEPQLFHSVCHRHEIFLDDPLDVSIIHRDARDVFERMLQQATTPPGLPSGRMLLIKGEGGAGKTHLMRAFRSYVHGQGLGYFGYMQMTSETDDYAGYVLANLVTSLDQPYRHGEPSSLMRLSTALYDAAVPADMRELLTDEKHFVGSPHQQVQLVAGEVLKDKRFQALDLDLIRALLYLQREDPLLKGRVLAWLRCEDLSEHDRGLLGGLVPRTQADAAPRMIEQLGRVMWAVSQAALVVCVDQLEDMVNMSRASERFKRAMTTLCALSDRVPSSVFVVSCISDYYEGLSSLLSRSIRDRLEKDPAPILLERSRSVAEVMELVETRLRHLYAATDAGFYRSNTVFPFTREQLAGWNNFSAREVLDSCRAIREQAMRLGRMPDGTATGPLSQDEEARRRSLPSVVSMEQRWNDFLTAWKQQAPDDEGELAALLARGVAACTEELESGHRLEARAEGRFVEVDVLGADGAAVERLLVGVSNGVAQGGKLQRQVEEVQQRAVGTGRVPALVRGTEYPTNPRTRVAQVLGELVVQGGRRVVMGPSCWRTLMALEAFRASSGGEPSFATWLGAENTLSKMTPFKELLNLAGLPPPSARPAAAQPLAPPGQQALPLGPVPRVAPVVAPPQGLSRPAVQAARPATPVRGASELLLGTMRDVVGGPLTWQPADLKRHAAFLGGTGSGKTTLAMRIIEDLLMQGVPAVLLDRKGDLCNYASPEAWTAPARDEAHAARRAQLRERIEVTVYTPGSASGRPLSIPLAPLDLATLPTADREQLSMQAAFAVGSMLDYRGAAADKAKVAILGKAIGLLAQLGREVTLEALLGLVVDPDPSLAAAVGALDPRLFKKVAQELQTLLLTGGPLVSAGGPQLDVGALLGKGRPAGSRTPLSIISTKFLGDQAAQLFFVSQLLIALSRWSSKNPSDSLQAVLFTDEADMYLPALRQPPTKEPFETLLKRARTAGLSVMLATQSPGDLDYRSRDNVRSWCVGVVKETVALAKMKPMLTEVRGVDVAERIPRQTTGEFYVLRDGQAVPIRAERSAIDTVQLSEDEILRLARG